MKMTTKDFLNRYDEFMNEKDNSNERKNLIKKSATKFEKIFYRVQNSNYQLFRINQYCPKFLNCLQNFKYA